MGGAWAGQARVRAPLLKHGGGGVKTGKPFAIPLDRISLLWPTRPEAHGDFRPCE